MPSAKKLNVKTKDGRITFGIYGTQRQNNFGLNDFSKFQKIFSAHCTEHKNEDELKPGLDRVIGPRICIERDFERVLRKLV